MPSYIFKDLTKQRTRPMTSITMYFAPGYFLEFSNLGVDSTHSVELVTKPDAKGGVRILGAQLSITIFPMQDDFDVMMPQLIAKSNLLCDVQFHLGATDPFLDSQPHPTINANGWAHMDTGYGVSWTWGYESADKTRRPKISLSKFYRITDAEFETLFTSQGEGPHG